MAATTTSDGSRLLPSGGIAMNIFRNAEQGVKIGEVQRSISTLTASVEELRTKIDTLQTSVWQLATREGLGSLATKEELQQTRKDVGTVWSEQRHYSTLIPRILTRMNRACAEALGIDCAEWVKWVFYEGDKPRGLSAAGIACLLMNPYFDRIQEIFSRVERALSDPKQGVVRVDFMILPANRFSWGVKGITALYLVGKIIALSCAYLFGSIALLTAGHEMMKKPPASSS